MTDTAADRNTTADALDRWSDASNVFEDTDDDRAVLALAARLLRTPDTPTDSDTAARARALLDAATPGPWDQVGATVEKEVDAGWCVVVADCDKVPDAALIAAAPTLITDLLAEVDRLNAECRQLGTKMTGDTATDLRMIYAYELGLAEAEAERDAAVARADRLQEALDELTVEHRPMWSAVGRAGFTLDEQPGYKPVGCCMCFPADGSWPCATRLIADAADRGTDR